MEDRDRFECWNCVVRVDACVGNISGHVHVLQKEMHLFVAAVQAARLRVQFCLQGIVRTCPPTEAVMNAL